MKKWLLIILILTGYMIVAGQDISNYKYQLNVGEDFLKYKNLEKAKEYFILAYNNPKSPKDIKSKALYYLGEISYKSGNYKLAITDWDTLINTYEDSKEAKELIDRLPEIKESIAKGYTKEFSPLEIANDFLKHNFAEKAKEKFLDIYHDPKTSSENRAEALYLLGQISFEQGNYSVALDDWEILIKKFPNSKQTIEIAQRLSQMRDVITQDSDTSIISAVAKSYLQNGDFWSNAKNRFDIDSSWLPSVELAYFWYDKIIKEFPKTNAGQIAYRRKLFTLLGWKEPGKYGDTYGVQKNFKKYIPLIISTFNEYEKFFPNSSYLQGFRYQIAQVYWMKKDWKNAKTWLNKVLQHGNGDSTFYTETAKERLKFLKY